MAIFFQIILKIFLKSSKKPFLKPTSIMQLGDTFPRVFNGAKSELLTYLTPINNHNNDTTTDSELTDTDDPTSTDQPSDQFEEHKNQILLLLPELKIGTDLSKVKIPAFLLEKRSLLELFADCMCSHSDMFIRIDDCDTPEDRMLSVLDWYLTSFHLISQVITFLL